MFKKEKCKNCGERIKDNFGFCPFCGDSTGKGTKKDYGMLGKNDSKDPFEEFSKGIFGGMSGKMLNKMVGSAMKMLEKEMQKNMRETKKIQPETRFELYINGKKISPENIKVTKKTNPPRKAKQKQNSPVFSPDSIKRFSSLPKSEPKTNIRRLADKVIYEIEIPGVESIEDISIAKLESSIEVKAVGKDQAYSKLIPINLPISKYKLEGQTLVLELSSEE